METFHTHIVSKNGGGGDSSLAVVKFDKMTLPCDSPGVYDPTLDHIWKILLACPNLIFTIKRGTFFFLLSPDGLSGFRMCC